MSSRSWSDCGIIPASRHRLQTPRRREQLRRGFTSQAVFRAHRVPRVRSWEHTGRRPADCTLASAAHNCRTGGCRVLSSKSPYSSPCLMDFGFILCIRSHCLPGPEPHTGSVYSLTLVPAPKPRARGDGRSAVACVGGLAPARPSKAPTTSTSPSAAAW